MVVTGDGILLLPKNGRVVTVTYKGGLWDRRFSPDSKVLVGWKIRPNKLMGFGVLGSGDQLILLCWSSLFYVTVLLAANTKRL